MAPAGRRLPLSPSRRLVGDVLHFARRVPSVVVQRRMHLSELVAARAATTPPVSWSAIFLKAYAAVAVERPELRRCYLPWPRPHLYEHPFSVASFAVERRVGDEA